MSNPKKKPFDQDFSTISQAITKAYEMAAPAMEKFMQQAGDNDTLKRNLDPLRVHPIMQEAMATWANEPEKLIEAQQDYWQSWFTLCQDTHKRMMGEEPAEPVAAPNKGDRRFRHEEWDNNAVFDFIKQSYLLTCNAVDKTIQETPGIAGNDKEKLAFTARLYANAMSPSNFAMTNPAVIEETINTGGENLIKGFENLMKDFERGQGELAISATDYNAFEVGKNIATTKGAVVYENELMQLIQYEPLTESAAKRPLLVIPPWINKYYILDMQPENSYVRWATEQGHTVFIISWVNPDKTLAHKDFEDYMKEGVLDACKTIQSITKEPDLNAVGYCIGGTLLATTLAYLEEKGQADMIASATFLTTLLDFEHAGELKMFLGEEQIEALDKVMQETGIFEAKQLGQTFKLLRSNDLIWSFVVNNYLMGKEPFPFDLLYWNDDSTNMPAAMQSFYLRNMYRDNKLTQKNGITIDGVKIDLSRIKTPAYFLSTREDHIAPWQATYQSTQLTGGQNTFTLAASGHIAGIINPPAKNKYSYWSSNSQDTSAEKWLESATETAGSWWPHWQEWMKQHSGGTTKARTIKDAIEPAPGRYVKKKA